ncbi:MAG TPA: TonB family protein [Candidatus Baltobacteraceae bacterium]|nr:TonB family protein [Candidatus Baltobacteraceae bacterium]
MSAASNGRVVRIALAVSLAVHLVVAAVIYAHPVKAAPPPKPEKSYLIHLPRPTPTPDPPKPSLPHPRQKSTSVRRAIHPPRRIAQVHTDGPHIAPFVTPTGDPSDAYPSPGPVGAAPTPGPVEPAPTPKPACSAPDIPAKTLVTQTAVAPVDAAGYTGQAKVQVDLDASGGVVNASVYQSTGSMELDRAALAAARASRYAPEERDCKNVSGSYLFVVDFQ